MLTDEGEPVQVALHLRTRDVSLAPDSTFPVDFGLAAGEGSVALDGRLGLNPLLWDGRVEWKGLAVPLFVRAALPELVPWIQSCRASGDLAVKLSPEELRASGDLGVDDLALEDPEHEVAFGWKSLAIALDELRVPLVERAPIEVVLSKVSLEAPQARYVLPNTAFERLGGAEADAAAEPEAPPAEEAPAPRIAIEVIEVRDGSAEFVDRSGPQPYQGRISSLRADIAGVKLPERTVQRARVRGLAPERAAFDLDAALPGASGTVRFTLERLPLAQFTPYSARAADLRIPKGALSIQTQGRLARSGAAGAVESRVVVHELAVQGGPNAVSVAGMPIDVALGLLRDPHGDIALTVPVQYGEQGASAGIGAIVLGALQAAIAGAVTSPIKALGAAMPEGGDASVTFAPVAFAPGDATLSSDASASLGAFAALLAERPGLALALSGSAGPADRDALAEQLLAERVARGGEPPEIADTGFFARRRVRAALVERARGGAAAALEPEDEELLRRYRDATEVPPERFAALARGRAEAVRDALASLHGIAPARLLVEAAAEPGPAEVVPGLRAAG